jgi:hypothetical protein
MTGIHVAPRNQNKSENITRSSDAMEGYNAELGISIQISNANVPNRKRWFLTLSNTDQIIYMSGQTDDTQ